MSNESGLGLLAIGAAPGGGGSNVFAYLLDGDLELSITMSFISTIASLGTPVYLYNCLSVYLFLSLYPLSLSLSRCHSQWMNDWFSVYVLITACLTPFLLVFQSMYLYTSLSCLLFSGLSALCVCMCMCVCVSARARPCVCRYVWPAVYISVLPEKKTKTTFWSSNTLSFYWRKLFMSISNFV